MEKSKFYKEDEEDNVWWLDSDGVGEYLFSFDREHVFNLFRDYPHKLTPEQKRIFDKENPLWAEYFRDRSEQ